MKLYSVLKNIVKGLVTQVTNEEIDAILGTTSKPVSDYVVEQGTSGIWTYRKWNNGIAECWCRSTTTTANTGTVWSSPIYGYALPVVNYPFTFTAVPTEFASPVSSLNAFWVYKSSGSSTDNTTTKSSQYYALKVNAFNNNSPLTIAISVKGRWK